MQMGIAAARDWASKTPGEDTTLPPRLMRDGLIACARLAVAEHERAEAAEREPDSERPRTPDLTAKIGGSVYPVESVSVMISKEVDLRAAVRVYRRALVAIREIDRLREAVSKIDGSPVIREVGRAADNLKTISTACETELGPQLARLERKSADLEIEHREQADVWERELTAAMLERLLPGEAGAILSCLVRGCFQHWSPEDGIPEDLSFTDD